MVLDWGIETSLNPVNRFMDYVVYRIIEVHVVYHINLFHRMPRIDPTEDSPILGVCPVGELVFTEGEVLFGSVVLCDDSVVVHKSLKTKCKLLHVLVNFVEAGNIIHEVELVGTDGGGGRSKGGKSEILHLKIIRLNFIND